MTKQQIPEQMTAVVLDSYSGPEALRVEQRPVPEPGANEVLVKVAAAPINPSDLAFLEGQYGFKNPLPVVPGQEGAGTVVAVGPGPMGRYFLGKRVTCLWGGVGNGVWAEYAVVSARGGALPLFDSVSLEQGAMAVVNPLTATAFLEIAKKGGHKTIVLTAAASALGQMVNRLGRSAGVQVISIVRREAQVELLKQQGATVVLNSSEAHFDQELRDVCQQHDARLAFDAVAGPMTGRLLNALPQRSKVTVFGGLSLAAVQVDPSQFVFKKKSVDGFWLGPWITEKNLIQILRMWRRAQQLLTTELSSEVRARYTFQEAKKAVQAYLSQMTGGKILLVPGSNDLPGG
jgi:NADPH:quinone reductase-like Zn-dependent oxidoreductase